MDACGIHQKEKKRTQRNALKGQSNVKIETRQADADPMSELQTGA
jgi:hypothetical protein